MKPCPICHTLFCPHTRKFYLFGLTKVIIVKKSLDATVSIFSKLMNFLPTNTEMQNKLNSSYEDLRKCQDRVNDVHKWIESKITPTL